MPRNQAGYRVGIKPSDEMVKHILDAPEREGLTLKELFVTGRNVGVTFRDRKLDKALTLISSTFRPGKPIGNPWVRRPKQTDHYLVNMDGSVDQLVGAIAAQVKSQQLGSLVSVKDLPIRYQRLPDFWRNKVLAQARYLLLREAVAQLVGKSLLWHHEADRIWQAAQSVIDPRPRRHKRSIKWDKREWHGRNPSARGTVPPGTSIGLSRR